MWCFSICLFYISFILVRMDLEVTGINKDDYYINYKTYTKDNPNEEVDIRDVNFNHGIKTKYIVHGYSTSSLNKVYKVKNFTFKFEPDVVRVVIVDWTKSNCCNYDKIAKKIVPAVAEDLTKTLIYVEKKGNGKIELVGHSLGAHIAGQAGRLFEQETGKKIDSIIALDPAGPYFTKPKDRDKAIKCTDARQVQVIHTDTDGWGYPYKICPDDIFPNGGKKQPECKNKPLEIACSHSAAWDRYLEKMQNKTVIEYPESKRYVLCLDISPSMRVNNRLDRVQGSAKQVIASMTNGSYLGIVSFGGHAQINHPIVQITGKSERDSLISSIPSDTIDYTCIKVGLETSKDMLKQSIGNDKVRSTIVLITNGQNDCRYTPSELIPELVKAGIRVKSFGLGISDSNELENLADKSGGEVFYVVEESDRKMISNTFKAGGLLLQPLNIFTFSVISYSVYHIVYLRTFIK